MEDGAEARGRKEGGGITQGKKTRASVPRVASRGLCAAAQPLLSLFRCSGVLACAGRGHWAPVCRTVASRAAH